MIKSWCTPPSIRVTTGRVLVWLSQQSYYKIQVNVQPLSKQETVGLNISHQYWPNERTIIKALYSWYWHIENAHCHVHGKVGSGTIINLPLWRWLVTSTWKDTRFNNSPLSRNSRTINTWYDNILLSWEGLHSHDFNLGRD